MTVPYAPLPPTGEDVEYAYGPDSSPRPGVEPGRQSSFTIEDPRAFPGTTRRVVVHVPAAATDAPLLWTLFQDGSWYLDPAGAFRADVVLDNLIADGAIPPMVGIFVDPGIYPDKADEDERKNRNHEYDADDATYATFLIEEVLPRVREHATLSDDPRDAAIAGGSSGGDASFTAAWHRPDVFGRVLCLGGSFPQMPGGNPYPALIASTPRKPLRILLSTAHHDNQWNEPEFNWFADTLDTAAALARAGYDFRLVLREGGHNMLNGGVLLPDALRWVWAEPGAGPSES